MNEDRFTSENAWYHFALGDMVTAMRLYGWDQVQKDLIERYHAELATVEHVYD